MKLFTPVPIPDCPVPIDYRSHLVLVGSCFTTLMACKLEYFQFQHQSNPFGILYHPLAIENLLTRAIRGRYYTGDEIFFHGEAWHSFEAHSELNRLSGPEMLEALNNALRATKETVGRATHLILTLGSAWVYRHRDSGSIVANCHKLPQKLFSKELLSAEEVCLSLRRLCELVREANSQLQLIFTISPVRHLKDGFTGNQRSKASLVTGLHAYLEQSQNSADGYYFPSYELVLDELRDYRYFDADLVHPNALAADYVWEKFREACIAPEAFDVMEEVDTIRKGLQHKPFNPDSVAHQAFINTLQQKIAYLKQRYPGINF